jgi:D-serine deaminase-like pyridoxal phosphate-dependent protein
MPVNRRQLLFGGAALSALAWLKPGDEGGSYDPYFADLNRELQSAGVGRPRLLVDLDRLDANIDQVTGHIVAPKTWRIVVKSLPSPALLRHAMERSGSRSLMAFNQPFMNILAAEFPDADLLLGKPQPVAAVAEFYRGLGPTAFDPQAQIQWLIDTDERLTEYQQLARALGTRMRISLELDVGLHRGGFADPAALQTVLARIAGDPQHLELAGFMGYEAFIAKLPGQEGRLATVIERYKGMVESARLAYPQLLEGSITYNIGGSQTYQLYRDEPFFNDVSMGSGLVMPTDFDMPTLASHQPASWIATPILKHYDSVLVPGIEPAAGLFSGWNPNRQQAFYIYGGNWQADYENPPGLVSNPVWGHSSNQEMVNASRRVDLAIGDFVFLRPRQSEAVFLQFGDILTLRGGQLSGAWPVFAT